jgi:two-component sensor histidine kinase
LHLLDEQKLLAGIKQVRFEGRISASIHKTLNEIASQGVILHELLYKLIIAPILLKPLRERRKDIPLLADTFIKACVQRLPGPPKQFCDDAIQCLQEHSWPGNLPELESVIYRSVLFSSALNLERQNILFAPALPESRSAEYPPAQSSTVVSMPKEHAAAGAQTAPLGLSIAHLVAELSHEIKNPLVAIKTFIQLFPGHMNDPEFLSEFFSIAEKSTDRIDYLTERMLEFAKLSEPRFDNVSFVSVLQEAYKNIEAAGPKLHIAWNPESLEQIPKVRADFEQLRYSLENILLYIAHNTPDGRPVEIAPGGNADAAALTFSYTSDKNVQGLAFHNANGDRISDLSGLDLFLAQQVLQKNSISCTKHHANGQTIITIQLPRL